jgi:hypothetical protein
MNVKQYLPSGDGLSKVFKGAAILGGVYIAYQLLDKFVLSREDDITKKDVNKDLTALGKAGITKSYKDSQYEIWASQLYGAINTIVFGIDEDAIIRILGYMKNDADILQLIKAFGTRELEGGLFRNKGNGTLPELVAFALNEDEIKVVNLDFQRKRITYRF